MTLIQLEYIVALDKHRHFAAAAKSCFITQPTLSMQIQKLEEELGVKIFDRSKQPVLPTEQGLEVLEHAKRILAERDMLNEMIASKKDDFNGTLRVGIIPTLAPYLLPLFIHSFTKKYPSVKLHINELNTENIVMRLKEGRIDAGILVTPLNDTSISEQPVFYEEMVAYVSEKNTVYKKNYVLPNDIDPNKLWLLEEGHCFRSQIMNLCELRHKSEEGSHFEYGVGSFETLRRMVDLYDGITILPELALGEMSVKQKNRIRYFKQPAPVREVSIVVHRTFLKRRLVEILRKEIIAAVPEKMHKNKKSLIIPI